MKEKLLKLGADYIAMSLAEKVPAIVDNITKKKEEKSFFEVNKWWIFLLVLSIFAVNLNYINMFENVILNSIINIVFGIILLVLLCLFFYEEKNAFKINSLFIKFLVISIIILGMINSGYHIGYAIRYLVNLVL